MSINSHIQDPSSGINANVFQKEGLNSLSVVTQEYKNYRNRSIFFSNPTWGTGLNQDFYTDTIESIEYIHNGEDNNYWTASTIVGTPQSYDFSSTDYAHTGTQSIDATGSADGNTFQLLSPVIVGKNEYDRLVGWIYITSAWNSTDDDVKISLYNTNTGITISQNIVGLKNYIDGSLTGAWQRFSISMSRFGILNGDYNALRFITNTGGEGAPNYYLDDIQLESLSSEEAIFEIAPPRGEWWHVTGFGIVIASPYNPVLADSTMPKIPYDGLLGVTLSNGIIYRRKEEGVILFSFVMNNLIDIINQVDTRISSYGSDGTNTWIKIDINFKNPFLLKSEYEDFISFNVSDNLGALNYFRVVADVREERRESGVYKP